MAVPAPTRWITDTLTRLGPQPPLEVARAVWRAYEDVIRSTGDLLLTWQLDLHAAAETMQSHGALSVDPEGRWHLTGSATAPLRRAWGEDEIAAAVEAYVALLRAEHAGTPLRRSDRVDEVLARTGRTPAQVEAMMANISAVVQEHGHRPLAAYPPRSNVPVGVRPAVAAALGDHPTA